MFWCKDRLTILKGSLRFVMLIALIATALTLFSSQGYEVSGGRLSFQIDRPHHATGQVVVSLGPAGLLKFDTHKTPFDIKADYVLAEEMPDSTAVLIDSLVNIEPEAENLLKHFVYSRIPWIILLGALIGGLLTNGGTTRWILRAAKNCGFGIAFALLFSTIILAITVATIDRTPNREYEGLVANFQKVAPIIDKVRSGKVDKSASIESFVRGIGVASAQMGDVRSRQEEEHFLVLCVSDVHDHEIGARLVRQIVKTERFGKISLILLAGDTTNYGSETEANIFSSEVKANNTPVFMVGGNHEDRPAMNALKRAGYFNLSGVTSNLEGINVFGEDDPSAYNAEIAPSNEDDVLAKASESLLVKWDALVEKPNILLVHNLKQAEGVLEEAKKAKDNLVVVYGHDHKANLELGKVTLVDAGSSGASGYGKTGQDPNSPYTFQILDFSMGDEPVLTTVISLSYEGLTGNAKMAYKYIN